MLIQEFCRTTGLSRDAVRLYVRRKLLKPDRGSTANNRYQVFDAAQVERARLIKAAQAVGFSLWEIAKLGATYERGGATRAEKARIIEAQLNDIVARVDALKRVQAYLTAKLRWVTDGEAGAPPMLKAGSRAARRKAVLADA